MRLTEHFTKEEMEKSSKATVLGLDNTMPDKYISNALRVAVVLEKIREHFNLPITILSCYRSPEVNQKVGGAKTSAHLQALAADFIIKGISNRKICEWVVFNITDFDQIIYEFGETGWCHIGLSYNSPRKQILSASKTEDGKTHYQCGLKEKWYATEKG